MKRDSSFLNDALDNMPHRKEEHVDADVDPLDIVMATLHESDPIYVLENATENHAEGADIWLAQIDENSQETDFNQVESHAENSDLSFENTELDDCWTII